MRYIFYYEVGCFVCDEVELVLQQWIPNQYTRIRQSRSHIPGKNLLWLPDGPVMIEEDVVPGVPALYDKDRNELYVGDKGIYNNLHVDGEA